MSLSVNNETSFQFSLCPKLHKSLTELLGEFANSSIDMKREKNISKCVCVIFVDEFYFVQMYNKSSQILSVGPTSILPRLWIAPCGFFFQSIHCCGHWDWCISWFLFLLFLYIIKSVICWPSSSSYPDNLLLVLLFPECPKSLIATEISLCLLLSPVFIPSLGHCCWCSQVLVSHFCWQLPNLFFYLYPLTLSWLSLCWAWLPLWHFGSELIPSNFLKLRCSLKTCLNITFISVFIFFFHWFWWMQQNLWWFPVRSVININY